MAVERQAGYEYRGWKLGEKVKWIKDGKEHIIIAFFEGTPNERYYIALDCVDGYHDLSKCLSTTILAVASCSRYMWVKEKEIEKIENAKNQQQKKVLYGEDAVEYLRKNYSHVLYGEDKGNDKLLYLDIANKVECVLDRETGKSLMEEIRKIINKETLEKINNYDYEREAEKKQEQVKEFVVTKEMSERLKEITIENFKKASIMADDSGTRENNIKPSYYKINVAGNDCEVKDVIKAFVKDYDSFLVGNIIKYIARYKNKNGLEDVKKSKEYIEELIKEMEVKHE